MPKHLNFIYKLEGEALEEGINVFELSPILLSMGKLIQESQRTLYPELSNLAVNVKPFKKGSFEVDIILFAKTNIGEIVNFFNQDSVRKVNELLQQVGLIAGITGVSLLELIKFLKGKPKQIIKVKDCYEYKAESGSITVEEPVNKLFNNSNVVNSVVNIYQAPIENIGVDKITTYIKNEEIKTKVMVTKSDFMNITSIDDDETESKILSINTYKIWVSPKRGSFDGDPINWSFKKDKDTSFTVTIKDELFLSKYNNREYFPHPKDKLYVEIKEKQREKNNGEIITTRELVKVLEYPANNEIQLKLEEKKNKKISNSKRRTRKKYD